MGKTDFWLQVAIRLYTEYGCQTVWIRNKKVELSEDGNYTAFLNDAKHFGWCSEDWDARPDGVYTSTDKDADQIIKFASISTFSNKRGGGHPRVMLMVFDEMIPEDRRYPKMCAQGLLSLANSMTRGRCKIIVCSNFVSAGNPYFALFEIYNNPKYDVTLYNDKSICIELAKGYRKAIKEESDFSKLMRAGKMPQYEDENSDPLIGLVSPIPKGSRPAPFLYLIDGKYYREWERNGMRYYDLWSSDIPSNIVVYTPNVNECTDGVLILPSFLIKHMNDTMQANLMRFKNPNVMFKILNVIYNAV